MQKTLQEILKPSIFDDNTTSAVFSLSIIDKWQELCLIISEIDLDIISQICLLTLKNIATNQDVTGNYPDLIKLKNLGTIKTILLEKCTHNDREIPTLVEFSERLAQKVEEPTRSQLNQWVKTVAKELNIKLPTYSDTQSSGTAQSYLLVTVTPKDYQTGKPGSGKTSLAYAIAYELNLGPVLSWSITTRSTLQEGLYRYDAIARLQDAQPQSAQISEEQEIGKYITLGPLGTAFLPSHLPRLLLIDEIDKSDINLPNDLLNIFEEGEFEIPELVRRYKPGEKEEFQVDTQDQGINVSIQAGRVRCYAFPIIVMTSNGERDFPPAFKRRCVRVRMPDPNDDALKAIVKAHFGEDVFERDESKIVKLISEFRQNKNQSQDRATDQLLNTIYVLTREVSPPEDDEKSVKNILFKNLSSSD